MSDRDRILIRAKDIGLLIGVLTCLGFVWKVYGRIDSWDEAARTVAEIKPVVQRHDTEVAVIMSKLNDIGDEVHAINRKLGR